MTVTDEQTFRQILKNLEAALDAWYNGDPYPYGELFDEKITYFDPMTTERIATRTALREHYSKLEGQFVLPKYEIIEPVFDAIGEARLLTYFLRQYSADGPFGPTWKTTELYTPVDSQWRIVHAHWSAIAPER